MYSPVVRISPDFILEMNAKERKEMPLSLQPYCTPQDQSVDHQRMDMDNLLFQWWFVWSFSLHPSSRFITSAYSENVYQVRAKQHQIRSFIFQSQFYFLRITEHFNFNARFKQRELIFDADIHCFDNVSYGIL